MGDTTDNLTTVIILKPGHPTVRLGPCTPETARRIVAVLHQHATPPDAPQGTRWQVVAYDSSLEQESLDDLPRDPWDLAALMVSDAWYLAPPHAAFPGLLLRLKMVMGGEDATRLWLDACAILDAGGI